MGILDLFKKKDNEDSTSTDSNNKFDSISKYKEYIKLFIIMQQQGNYSPIAAYENGDRELIGHLYMNGDGMYTLSAQEVIEKMIDDLENRLSTGSIKSYAILYHSANDEKYSPATEDEELRAIAMRYHLVNGSSDFISLPYQFDGEEITYSGFSDLSADENNIIFNFDLTEGKEYFTDRIEIKSEFKENEAGIKVRISNNTSVSNTWCGLVGFERFREKDGSKLMEQWMKTTVTVQPIVYSANNVHLAELNLLPITLQAVNINNDWCTFYPVIASDYAVDVKTSEINEWQDVNNALAIVRGQGRETFGVKYLATDYAKNRQKYLTQKNHNIKFSGIIYVLDIEKETQDADGTNYSPEFTGYFPNKDLAEYGCFDFVGKLEDMKKVTSIEECGMKGYLLKVKLINNPDHPDFFTIDMFVNKDNMRFENLEVGMKLTGMFQMQGQIAD